jgi:CheY-like chemotaxis protein
MVNVEVEKGAETEFPDLSSGRYVVLTVRDNGCGMSQEVKRRAFDPFFTTKEEGGGVELGLATVYGTIRQSAGGVMVESEPGLGTTIRIYLPAVEDEAIIDDESIPPSPPPDPASCEVVLVVEDDDMVRALIRHVLQSQGYTVLEAKRPEEAIAVCENHQGPVHLLATDIVMPGMDGGRLAERIMGLRPDIRVLFLSGYAHDATLNDRAKEGRVSHLQKPFDIETLVDRVREALGRH